VAVARKEKCDPALGIPACVPEAIGDVRHPYTPPSSLLKYAIGHNPERRHRGGWWAVAVNGLFSFRAVKREEDSIYPAPPPPGNVRV
jgi:hypothetical protein